MSWDAGGDEETKRTVASRDSRKVGKVSFGGMWMRITSTPMEFAKLPVGARRVPIRTILLSCEMLKPKGGSRIGDA